MSKGVWLEAGDLPVGKVKVTIITKKGKEEVINGKVVKTRKTGKKYLTTNHKGSEAKIKTIKQIRYLDYIKGNHSKTLGSSGIKVIYPKGRVENRKRERKKRRN